MGEFSCSLRVVLLIGSGTVVLHLHQKSPTPWFSSVVAPPLHPLKEEPASFEQLDQTQDASKKRISLLPNRLMLIIQREILMHLPGALYCALLLRRPQMLHVAIQLVVGDV